MTLALSGALTVREVTETRQTWLSALAGSRGAQLLLDAGNLTAADTAGAQLVLALRRECARQGGELIITPADGALADALNRLALEL